MSKYTTEIRFICEDAAGYDESKGYADVDEIISKSIDKIFSFDFPLFDGQYRDVLCTKILRHYYTREIGFETVGLWRLKLQTKLNEIMPYYNQLYLSELLKFNPLYDVDLKTTHVGGKNSETDRTNNTNREDTRNGISVGNTDRNSSETNNKQANAIEGENRNGSSSSETGNTGIGINKVTKSGQNIEIGNDESNGVKSNNYSETTGGTKYDVYSETPQGALTGVESGEYLTNARKITDSGSKNGKNDDTSIEAKKYAKTGQDSSEEKAENSVANSENAKANFDESTNRTNVTAEAGESTAQGNESNVRTNVENGSATESGSSKDKYNSTESYVLHVAGKQGGISYSKMLKEFRETFLNIDMEVINSLSDLFMNLW